MVTAVLIALLFALITYGWYLLRKHLSYWRNLNIPCDQPHWLVGNLQDIIFKKPFAEVWQCYYAKFKNSGPFVGFYWFNKPGVFVLDPSLIKQILIKEFAKFTDHGMYCNDKDDPLTASLFNMEGIKWRNMRNKLSPAFTSVKMKTMFPLVIREGQELVEVLHETTADNCIVEVRDLVSRFTTDVIGSCAFGIEINSLRKPDAKFRNMCHRALVEQRPGIVLRFSYPHLARRLRIKQTVADVEKYFMGLIKTTVECREQANIRRNDFLDMLIELKENKLLKTENGEEYTNLTFGQMAAHIFSFLLAGFESTSTTVAFALYELAQNEEIQDVARQEVLRVLKAHNNQFTFESIKEMLYLKQIMQGKSSFSHQKLFINFFL